MSAASNKAKDHKTAAARKDPKGGLTAAGRAHLAKTEGSHLKPGVKKVEGEMSPEEMRRKGSFLRRHYGRAEPLPLQDEKGRPTRHALQAHAWGEPVPKTQAAVEKLAAKGARLLEKARAAKGGVKSKITAGKAKKTSRKA